MTQKHDIDRYFRVVAFKPFHSPHEPADDAVDLLLEGERWTAAAAAVAVTLWLWRVVVVTDFKTQEAGPIDVEVDMRGLVTGVKKVVEMCEEGVVVFY